MIHSSTKKYVFSRWIDDYFISLGNAFKFIIRFFKAAFRRPIHFREIIHHCFEVGVNSLVLITLTGFIIGIVVTKQSRPSLESFGATSWLPSLMGIAVIKALSPLLTGLICAGKVGSGIGAELGSMKVTEQIEAMEVSAINPFKYLVVTRVMATTIMIPILTMYCAFMALIGAYVDIYASETTSFLTFYQNAFSTITFSHIFTSVIRSVVFGFTIGMVGTYKGFYAKNGTQGVGVAANKAVVLSIFLIFIEEFIIVQVANWIALF